MRPTRYPAGGLALFMAAALVTFGCITVMQFLEKPWFFVALVAMHGGIALFVVSKRMLRSRGFQLTRYFKKEYLLLLPFLLIMFYSFASKAALVPPFGTAKGSIVFVYALVCFAVTFWNFRHMQREARIQEGDEANTPSPCATELAL